MASTYSNPALTPDLASLLAGLRRRIRVYIWLEGLSLAIIWLAAMFWVGLALDYLPVMLGANEMPAAPRAVLLAANGIVLAYVLYQWIGRRGFVPLADRSLALVLERHFPLFGDSLVTTVEMVEAPDHASPFSRELLSRTSAAARTGAEQVYYRQVFNTGALAWKVAAAALLVASIVGLYAVNAGAVERAADRLYWLSDEPWPRRAKIEVVGVDVVRAGTAGEEGVRTVSVPFTNNAVKVARGANVSLRVLAAQAPEAEVVPQQCTVYYRTIGTAAGVRGERGSVTMSHFRDSGGWRNFWFDSKPFKGVLSSIEFDVVGYDHRASGYRLEVVDSPTVVETVLDIVYPLYMVDEAAGVHLPVTDQPYLPAGTFIALGSQVTVKFKTNKRLSQAEIVPSDSGEPTIIDIGKDPSESTTGGNTFAYRFDQLRGSVSLDVSLLDADNVSSERPTRVFLTAIEDQPPQVEVALKGIGSAVTPDVVVPFRGKISDDYAVNRTWLALRINESGDDREQPFTLGKGGAVEQELDFRKQRNDKTGLEIRPGDKLTFSIRAADKFDLAGDPHVASGDRYQLDVVTPEELLAQLEVREIGLRRRFEQIIDEMTQLRDSLTRVKASRSPGTVGSIDPEDLRTSDGPDGQPLTAEQKAQRASELALLRVQRAMQQSQKSNGEVLGVAAGFLAIREELINNRVDTEDRKNRLKQQIADPLNQTCTEQFPQLDERLTALEGLLRSTPSAGSAAGNPSADSAIADPAIDQANGVLSELEAVLAKMQDLETYNELLDIVRDLLKDQQKLIERTEQERKRQTLDQLKKLE